MWYLERMLEERVQRIILLPQLVKHFHESRLMMTRHTLSLFVYAFLLFVNQIKDNYVNHNLL